MDETVFGVASLDITLLDGFSIAISMAKACLWSRMSCMDLVVVIVTRPLRWVRSWPGRLQRVPDFPFEPLYDEATP